MATSCQLRSRFLYKTVESYNKLWHWSCSKQSLWFGLLKLSLIILKCFGSRAEKTKDLKLWDLFKWSFYWEFNIRFEQASCIVGVSVANIERIFVRWTHFSYNRAPCILLQWIPKLHPYHQAACCWTNGGKMKLCYATSTV